MFGAAIVLGTLWVIVERHVSDPIVDIAMLIDPAPVGATLASLFLGFGLFGAFVLVPNLVQTPSPPDMDSARLFWAQQYS